MIITGVPGSGKTTVMREALRRLEEIGVKYRVVNYGDVMFEIMSERLGVKHRDEMRKIETSVYREIQREAGKRIAKMAEKSNVIVDTHCLIRKPEGYYPGLPIWVLEELKPDVLILVEADPVEISGRRRKDADRIRDQDRPEEIDEHQQMNRAIAMAYAALTGAAVKIVQNREGKLNEAVESIVEVLK